MKLDAKQTCLTELEYCTSPTWALLSETSSLSMIWLIHFLTSSKFSGRTLLEPSIRNTTSVAELLQAGDVRHTTMRITPGAQWPHLDEYLHTQTLTAAAATIVHEGKAVFAGTLVWSGAADAYLLAVMIPSGAQVRHCVCVCMQNTHVHTVEYMLRHTHTGGRVIGVRGREWNYVSLGNSSIDFLLMIHCDLRRPEQFLIWRCCMNPVDP